MNRTDGCPGDNTLAALGDGQPASAALLAHLAACVDCQEAVAASLRDSADDAPRYAIERVLGVGGMAVVARATDAVLQRPVALKILWGARGRDVEVLLREARLLARVSHPNIVTIHDAGVLPRLDVPFISMALVEGPSLRDWLTESHDWRDVVAVFAAAGDGLASAHEHGVVHADFKPANVLLADNGRRVLVSDFGLARNVDPDAEEPATGGWGGTPRYAAPEQRSGVPDTPADQYAFGVALHEALWGEHPSLAGTCPARGCVRVPRRLRRIVARCIQPDPQRRFASMAEAVAALRSTARTRRTPIVLVAALASVTVAGLALTRRDPCADASREHADAWTQTLRPTLSEAMGTRAWDRVSSPTDRWVRQWLERAEASCRAEEPAPVQTCLLGQWSLLTVLTERAQAGSEGVALALSQLPSVEACAAPLGESETSVEVTAAQIEACARAVAEGRALVTLGENAEARSVLGRAIERCEDAGLHGLAARAYHSRGVVRWNLGEVDASFEDLATASELAVRGGQFDVSAVALALSAQYVALHRHDFAVARQQLSMARAHAQRVERPGLDITLDRQEAWVAFAEGHDAEAVALMRAVMAREGLSKWQRATYASDLGTFLTRTDDVEGALEALREALALDIELFGPDHTSVAAVMFNQAVLLMRIQRWDEAVSLFEQVEAIYRTAVGPRSRITLYTMLNRADALCDAGRIDEAEAALELPRQSLERELANDPGLANTVHLMYAHVVLERGEFARARDLLLDLTATWTNPSPATATSLHRDLGFAELGLGNDAQARKWFARTLDDVDELDPWSRGATYFGQARALRGEGPCTDAARSSAQDAIDVWTAHGSGPALERAAEVRAWLDACPLMD